MDAVTPLELDGLFLDFYGTIATGDRQAVESVCGEIVADAGLDLSAAELAIMWGNRFFTAMDGSNGAAFRTLYEIEDVTLRETLDVLKVRLDPTPYARRLQGYWRDPPLHAEVAEFVARVRLPICVVSNVDRGDLAEAMVRRGLEWPYVVTSEEARSYKPDREIFEVALRLTGWRRERVLHVGDSLHSDVGGARAAGLRAGWVNRAHRIHDIGTHEPDYEFEDLLGVLALIAPRARLSRVIGR